MVSPALQLSVKMPENRLQVWAASLLAGRASPPPLVTSQTCLLWLQTYIIHWEREKRRRYYGNRAVVYYRNWSEVSTPSPHFPHLLPLPLLPVSLSTHNR